MSYCFGLPHKLPSKYIKVIKVSVKPMPTNIRPGRKFIVDNDGIVRCVKPEADQ